MPGKFHLWGSRRTLTCSSKSTYSFRTADEDTFHDVLSEHEERDDSSVSSDSEADNGHYLPPTHPHLEKDFEDDDEFYSGRRKLLDDKDEVFDVEEPFYFNCNSSVGEATSSNKLSSAAAFFNPRNKLKAFQA